jgi:hypothetical protein
MFMMLLVRSLFSLPHAVELSYSDFSSTSSTPSARLVDVE